MICERLLAALGVAAVAPDPNGPREAEGTGGGEMALARVDDVDRRYRDAIKAGALGVEPPRSSGADGREAVIRDGVSGAWVRIVSGGAGRC